MLRRYLRQETPIPVLAGDCGSKDIFFATRTRFNEGQLDNYSLNGLFIKIKEDLLVGEVVTVVDPNPDGDNGKRQGQIVTGK